MNYLITLICILIALALFAGAFYLSKYVVDIKYHKDKLEVDYEAAVKHIAYQEEHIAQLNQQLEYMSSEAKAETSRKERKGAWNPADMNSGVRM